MTVVIAVAIALAWLRAIFEWEAGRRDQPSSVSGAQAVALAHFLRADPDGSNVYPGSRSVASRTGVHRDVVMALRRRWVAEGWLIDTGHRSAGVVVYRLAIPEGVDLAPDEGHAVAPVQGHRPARGPVAGPARGPVAGPARGPDAGPNLRTSEPEHLPTRERAGVAPAARQRSHSSGPDQQLLGKAKQLMSGWNSLPGVRPAQIGYTLGGLRRHGDPDELLRAIAAIDLAPTRGETLWAWVQRATGCWVGSDDLDSVKRAGGQP